MNEQTITPGWDSDRVKRLLAHYETLSEEQQVAEDEEAARQQEGQAMIAVPQELLPAIRQLLAGHNQGSTS